MVPVQYYDFFAIHTEFRLKLLGRWGFPMTTEDLKHLVKGYLDGIGKLIEG